MTADFSVPAFEIRQGGLLEFETSKLGGTNLPIQFKRIQSRFNLNVQYIYSIRNPQLR